MSFDVKNATEINKDESFNILLTGMAGAGKSTLAATLPGKSIALIFDSNATKTYHDIPWIDYEEFLPSELNKGVVPLKSGRGETRKEFSEPVQYIEFEKKWNAALRDGFFDKYDNIIFDSITMMQRAIMDRTTYLNGRFGRMPEQADYAAEMTTTLNLIREATATKKRCCFISHIEQKEMGNDLIRYQLMATGKNRIYILAEMTEVLHVFKEETTDGPVYVLDTWGTKQVPFVRCSLRPAPGQVDVTISEKEWGKPAMQKRGLSAVYGLTS